MRYSWQLTKAKKLGLQKTELPYVHLHMPPQTSEEVEAAINAPPEDDSSEASSSRLTSISTEPEFQPSPKRKRESSGSPRVDLTGPSRFKKPRCTQDGIPSEYIDARSTFLKPDFSTWNNCCARLGSFVALACLFLIGASLWMFTLACLPLYDFFTLGCEENGYGSSGAFLLSYRAP